MYGDFTAKGIAGGRAGEKVDAAADRPMQKVNRGVKKLSFMLTTVNTEYKGMKGAAPGVYIYV